MSQDFLKIIFSIFPVFKFQKTLSTLLCEPYSIYIAYILYEHTVKQKLDELFWVYHYTAKSVCIKYMAFVYLI